MTDPQPRSALQALLPRFYYGNEHWQECHFCNAYKQHLYGGKPTGRTMEHAAGCPVADLEAVLASWPPAPPEPVDRCRACGCREWEHKPEAIAQVGWRTIQFCVCGCCSGWASAPTPARPPTAEPEKKNEDVLSRVDVPAHEDATGSTAAKD